MKMSVHNLLITVSKQAQAAFENSSVYPHQTYIRRYMFFSGGKNKKLSAKQAIVYAEALVVPPLALAWCYHQ
jgi:hypothetical protein